MIEVETAENLKEKKKWKWSELNDIVEFLIQIDSLMAGCHKI